MVVCHDLEITSFSQHAQHTIENATNSLPTLPWNSLGCALLLGENPEKEVRLFVRFEGGWDDDVLSGAQAETLRHLPQVDVGLAASFGSVVQEEVFGKVLLVAVHLHLEKQTRENYKLETIKERRRTKCNFNPKHQICFYRYMCAIFVVYSLGTDLTC